MCRYWKWGKNPTKSCLDNPHKKCHDCKECEKYCDYVAAKVIGELDKEQV